MGWLSNRWVIVGAVDAILGGLFFAAKAALLELSHILAVAH